MSSVISRVVIDADPVTGRWLRTGGKPILKTNENDDLVKA
jgi:hypothetical protein